MGHGAPLDAGGQIHACPAARRSHTDRHAPIRSHSDGTNSSSADGGIVSSPTDRHADGCPNAAAHTCADFYTRANVYVRADHYTIAQANADAAAAHAGAIADRTADGSAYQAAQAANRAATAADDGSIAAAASHSSGAQRGDAVNKRAGVLDPGFCRQRPIP